MRRLIATLVLIVVASDAYAQTQRLFINAFNNGPSTTSVNALNLQQTIANAQASISQNRLQILTTPGKPTTFMTQLATPGQCLLIPPQANIDTIFSVLMQAPPGVDMSITLQTGTVGCGGQVNNSAVVRLSDYNALDGQIAFVRIPLIDFNMGNIDYFNGRARAVMFQIPALPYGAVIQFGDMQLISRPRLFPISSSFNVGQMINQMQQGPPNAQWGNVRTDGRCGAGFGWAGCNAGQCCSTRGWCGSTPMHCLSTGSVLGQISPFLF
ncbi:Uncharacterized protein PBTT_09172 [Plasmodiophora brassicae]